MTTLESFNIDYLMLAEAQYFYVINGFEPIEVPWVVSEAASMQTAPSHDCVYITTRNEHLVGSAEQSFIQLLNDGKLKPHVDYCAITPCFRRDKPDETHSRWFMKLELFSYSNVNYSSCFRYLQLAERMFDEVVGVKVRRVIEENSIDLYHKNLELGSYGVRMLPSNKLITFGTGLALPRASLAMRTL